MPTRRAWHGRQKPLSTWRLLRQCSHGTFVSPAAYELTSIGASEARGLRPHPACGALCRRPHWRRSATALNATGFGLTLGLHTRIETTVNEVRARVRVGNLYVNRNQIGAVVGAQPFGGEGLSGTGPKAGGPHYLHRFAVERVCSTDTTASGGNAALMSMETE